MGDDDELNMRDHDMGGFISSSRRVDPDTVELTLIDGTVLRVDNHGRTIEGTYDLGLSPLPGNEIGITSDNVYHSETPTAFRDGAGDPEKSTIELTSLENTVTWLRSHAEYLTRLWHAMDEITEYLEGPSGRTTSSLGGFESVMKVSSKHDGLFQGIHGNLKTTIENLYDTIDALGKIIENYDTAEERNRATAAEWQRIFGEQASSEHSF